jgi:hypothetical protein
VYVTMLIKPWRNTSYVIVKDCNGGCVVNSIARGVKDATRASTLDQATSNSRPSKLVGNCIEVTGLRYAATMDY